MKKTFLFTMAASAGITLLSGCSSFDKAIGKTKTSPDEFQVVVRPPLTLPPNFGLRPSTNNSNNNGDINGDNTTVDSARSDAVSVTDQVLTQWATTEVTGFDDLFGLDQITPGIRTRIDEETIGLQIEKRLPIQILFGGQPNVGPNLVSDEEALRIRKALSTGEDITATPTPAIDPVQKTPLIIE